MGINPLADFFSPPQTRPKSGPSRQAPAKGTQNILGLITEFRKFSQAMTPEKAQAEIARLLSSGEMSQQQFQELRENAKFIMQFLK